MSKKSIQVCQGRWCNELGSDSILKKLKKHFAPLLGEKKAEVSGCRCTGYCETGVNVVVDDKIAHCVEYDTCVEQVLDESSHKSKEPRVIEVTDDFLGDI